MAALNSVSRKERQMSREKIKAFYEKVESDKRLQAKLKTVAMENERKAIAQVVKIASAAGFRFTADDLAKVRAARVEFFPGVEAPTESDNGCPDAQGCMPGFQPEFGSKDCCYYAQGSMPGFEVQTVETD